MNEQTIQVANDAKEILSGTPAELEIVGEWVWVEFPSRPAIEIREALGKLGFRWISKRGRWAHSCGKPSRHGKYDPRLTYGQQRIDLEN